MTGRPANETNGEPDGEGPERDARVHGPDDAESTVDGDEPDDEGDTPAADGIGSDVDGADSVDGDAEQDEEPSLRAAEGVPDWEDEYVDRVADRLFVNYDLEKERVVETERFDLYGELRIESSKHFLHPSVTYANHEAYEHLFVTRESRVSEDRLESLVDLGHDLADEWIEANEDHFSTTFTFVVVAPEIPDEVETFVEEFSERTLLKFGYNGEYKIRLVVTAPEHEVFVSSPGAEIEPAFVHWETPEETAGGPLRRLAGRLGL
ncbi:hypothetical protein [Natrialba sp. INN-245]|uniref:hypothetical protein n=1 Tax=Natrialba sp. INN-245 TaxID=2690967 RepID=UPI001F473B68|nr:hypothetical protein [Natrialba sp. INN-245]